MYVSSAPMSRHTVQFAKNYRAEQIHAAERHRTAVLFARSRLAAGNARASGAFHAVMSRVRHHQPTIELVRSTQRAAHKVA